jgi:hypothetical protein
MSESDHVGSPTNRVIGSSPDARPAASPSQNLEGPADPHERFAGEVNGCRGG